MENIDHRVSIRYSTVQYEFEEERNRENLLESFEARQHNDLDGVGGVEMNKGIGEEAPIPKSVRPQGAYCTSIHKGGKREAS